MTNSNIENDHLLVERFCRGDESAFAEIYYRYSSTLIGFVSAKLYSLEEARDLVHDIFVYLWTDRESIEIHTSLKSYLFGVARHRIIDHIRKNVTREEYAFMLQGLALNYENTIEKNLAEKDLGKFINEIVDNLPPRTKEIYQLSRNENKSISEISEMLHISNQTVKNQLTSALKYLRDSLKKYSALMLWYVLLDLVA